MKKKKDWVSDSTLYSLFDGLLEAGAKLDDLNGYSAATSLKVEANGRFYEVFRQWKNSRSALAGRADILLPTELVEGFKQQLETFHAQIVTAFIDTAKTVGAEIQTHCQREVVAAREATGLQYNENGHLVDLLREAEQQRDDLEGENLDLRERLDNAERERLKAQGQLEEKDRLIQQLLTIQSAAAGAARSDNERADQASGSNNEQLKEGAIQETNGPTLPLEKSPPDATKMGTTVEQGGA